MIARIWHARTTTAKASAYLTEYFPQTGLADYQETEGNRGVVVLRKDEHGQADLLLLTFWESEESIRKFAGEDINQARYYPEDRKYFEVLEPNVAHYEVVIQRIDQAAK